MTGGPDHRGNTHLAGKRGDRLIIDDPHADQPEFVRWESRLDGRVRSAHAAFPTGTTFFDANEPARSLGRFNCRGDYVYPPGSILGNELPVIILSQSGGQIADVMQAMDVQIARTFSVPPFLMEPDTSAASLRLIEQRAREVSARIDAALLSGAGFPTAAEVVAHMQADPPAPLSRRRRRRLRGRAKTLRR